MKKILTVLAIALPLFAFAQETITVNKKDLSPELIQQLETKKKLEVYSEWAGFGKEIGGAIKEGLTAVKDVAVDFSKTDVGTFTMVLIAWKVVGQDVLGLIVGTFVFLIGVPIIIWSYRKICIPQKICTKDNGWFKSKEYEVVEVSDDVNIGGAAMLHGFAFFLLVVITCAIIF